MNDLPDYTDWLIRISAPRNTGQELYSVEATSNKDSLFFGGSLNLDREKLLANIQNNRVYGNLLWYALFTNPIERAYQRAWTLADEATSGKLRFRLQIDPDCSNLHILRWERLALPANYRKTPISVSGSTPFFPLLISRETSITQPLSRRPIRMTVAIAKPASLPKGLAPINIERELTSLRESIEEIHTPEKLRITLLPGITCTSAELRDLLTHDGCIIEDGPTTIQKVQDHLLNCDLYHHLGHGAFIPDRYSGTAVLFLEKTDGETYLAKDEEILSRLGDGYSVPRLVFLAACESAKRSGESNEAFVGLAPKLVQAGIPTVIGKQGLVPMQLAKSLTARFYHGLLEHGIIDQALNDSRLLLLESDWAIPVLFMRIKEGRLFDEDPLRSLLKSIVERSERFFIDKEPPLPLEVIRVTGEQSRDFLFRLASDEKPGDCFKQIFREILARPRRVQPYFAILLGSSGTAKSAYLRSLSGYFVEQTLQAKSPPFVLTFAHLLNCSKTETGPKDSFYLFLLRCLQENSPALGDKHFSGWLKDETGPTFLILMDGCDKLNNRDRANILTQLDVFASNFPRHIYLLLSDFPHFSRFELQISDIFVVKPLSKVHLKSYFKSLPDNTGNALYKMLEEARLFDLAALPWILVKILAQVSRGIIPHSRSGVLKNLEQDLIGKIPTSQNLHTRASQTLNALGWKMQRSRLTVLSIDKALQIMKEARGNREYFLGDLLAELVELRILAKAGDELIRFAYPSLQSWFVARCIQEAGSKSVNTAICTQVVNSLILLSSPANEPRADRRQQAVHTLIQLKAEDAIAHLVKLVLEKVRTNWQGEPAYDYSSVRLATVESLKNMVSPTSTHVTEHYPQYTKLLQCWIHEDIPELERQLDNAQPTHQTIAAFVLGNIGTRRAARSLLNRFRQPGVTPETRWAITDALLRLKPNLVSQFAVMPFIAQDTTTTAALPEESWKNRNHWYERVAYLIGKLHLATLETDTFLSHCLKKYSGLKLKIRAMRAVGGIPDTRFRELFEELARGEFANIAINTTDLNELNNLRRVAIETLGSIGDLQTQSILQQLDDGTNPILQKACHRASEEISWRFFERDQAVSSTP